jgi:hypothetical protein
MKLNRSIGFYLIACSLLCGVIAYDFYQSQVRTAKAVARQLDLTLDAIEFPIESKVAGFLCIAIGVAGAICLRDYFRQAQVTSQASKTNQTSRKS